MFYSDTILARKGPLASIWLAAHWDRRLSKHQIMTTDVSESIKEVMSGQLPPMALRLSGQLLLGASKIYHRKARYLLDDCTDALTRLRLSNSGASAKDVDLPVEQARSNQITIDTLGTTATTASSQPQPAQQRSVFEDDSFDLEGFLNAPVENVNAAQSRKLQNNLQLPVEVGRQAVKTVDQAQQPVSFGGGAGDDLLGEFAGMMDDVEVGRRQSSLANGRPSDSSILAPPPLELPSIAESVNEDDDDEEMELRSLKDSLPYSPLRPSISTPKQQQQQQLPQDVFSSPASSIKRRRNANNDNPTRRRRIANLVDSQTELSSGELQSQVRHHDDLLMPSNDEHNNHRMQSAAGAIMEPINLSDLLSKPGALLLPAGTDLSGLFAATMSIAPSPSIIATANPISSPKTPTFNTPNVDIPDMIEDDPFVADADADAVSVADQRSIVAESLSSQPQQSQQAALIDWTSLLRNKPVVLSSLIKTLTMAGRGLVRPEQTTPFGAITVHATVPIQF